MIKKKYQVFVSSTYEDLKSERQSAVEAILEAGHIPAGMELFAAGDKSQLETIKKWIDASDIYMLILGGRYGSIEPETGLSYIEVEYKYAAEKEKPLFAVVINEDEIKKKEKEFIEKVNTEKLATFRKFVLNKTSRFFSDTKDIKIAIHTSINELSEEREMTGWVRAIYAKTEEELQKSNDLYEQNKKLENELKELKTIVDEDTSDLAQGNDIIDLDFSVKEKKKKKDVTWDELFMVVDKQCVLGNFSNNENNIRSVIAKFVGKVIGLQNLSAIQRDKSFQENFEKIKIQFLSLGYIDVSIQTYTASNKPVSLWDLTKKGLKHFGDIIAIRKKTV